MSCPVLSLVRFSVPNDARDSVYHEQSPTKKPKGWHWKSNSQVVLLFEPQKQIQVNLNPSFHIQVTDQ